MKKQPQTKRNGYFYMGYWIKPKEKEVAAKVAKALDSDLSKYARIALKEKLQRDIASNPELAQLAEAK